MTAVNEAESAPTIVIGEDTDTHILLCYHANYARYNIFYTSDVKSGTTRKKTWDINQTKESLGFRYCKLLPVLHAFCGCDTTSHIYGVGSGVLLNRAILDELFRKPVCLPRERFP